MTQNNQDLEELVTESATDDALSKEQLSQINQRWEEFYHNRKAFLHRYAGGNDDLVSIGILSARQTLAENPDCPESWLVQRAKYDINTARAETGRVYLPLDKDQHLDDDWVNDVLQYQAMTPLQRNPENDYLDQVQFRNLLDSLSDVERKLLLILRDEQILKTKHRWWSGKYSYTQTQRPCPKKRFKEEVSKSETDWYISFANVRYQFYMHFGTDSEIAREKEWYAHFDPRKRLHQNRDSRYDKKNPSL